MNDKRYNTIFNIIKSKLFAADFEPQESVNWDEVALLLKNHGMILFLEDYINDIPIDAELAKDYKRIILNQKLQWERINSITDDITGLCTESGIPCAVIKGSSAAMYYTDPHLRAAGDIDLLTCISEYNRCDELLIDKGFNRYAVEYPEGHHNTYEKNNITIELHFRYIKSEHVQKAEVINPYIDQGLYKITNKDIDKFCIPVLPDKQNAIVLLYHVFFHLKMNGIGLRQIIDWMMFVHNSGIRDWMEVNDISQHAGLFELQKVMTRMCEIYLGLPHREDLDWCSDADRKLCEQLMEHILNCGNFGKILLDVDVPSKTRDISGVISAFSRLQKGGILRWKAAHKHRILRPFAWVYQAGRVGILLIKEKKPFRELNCLLIS